MNNIGIKLKELRKEIKLSQKQLSDYLGIDQTYLSKLENDERPVTIEILEKLAILYGIKIEDFDKKNIKIQPFKYSFRSMNIEGKDLEDISFINEIAYYSKEMTKAIEEKKW